jgi:hypothetical protein
MGFKLDFIIACFPGLFIWFLEIRQELTEGTENKFDASFDAEDDVVILRRLKQKPNWLAVWKQCPVPMDDLPPRSRERPRRLKL